MYLNTTENKPTIVDIAREAKVSIGTVSRVLNARGGKIPISEETSKRVLRVASEMNYVSNQSARGLRSGRSHLLSLVFPWNVPEIMDTAEKVASEHGYGIMMQFTPLPDPKMEMLSLRAMMERRVDGILWQPQTGDPCYHAVLEKLKKMGIKVVLLESSHLDISGVDVFDFDLAAGFKMAVDHLVERGYRRIVYLATSYIHQHYRNYLECFSRATASLSIPSEVVCTETAVEAGPKILEITAEGPMPVGIVCENDWVILEAIKMSRKHGIKIPQQIGLISTLDLVVGGSYPIGEITWPTVSAVSKPLDRLTRQAMELLIKRVRTRDESSGQKWLMPMELIVRESTNL